MYFAFGNCPLLADDELIMTVLTADEPTLLRRRYKLGDGFVGLALKLGTTVKGRLLTREKVEKRIETENGEMDDDWNAPDDEPETFNPTMDLRDLTINSDDEPLDDNSAWD